jgi:hypothetical protein
MGRTGGGTGGGRVRQWSGVGGAVRGTHRHIAEEYIGGLGGGGKGKVAGGESCSIGLCDQVR